MTRDADEPLTLENRRLRLTFDRRTGALTEFFHKETGDNYLKEPGGEGNLLRLYIDPTRTPRAFADADDWGGKVEGDLGGRVVDAKDFRLESARARRQGAFQFLTLTLRQAWLEATVTLRLADSNAIVGAELTVRNTDSAPHRIQAAFPHLTGLALGPDRATNRGLMQASFGTPGIAAWGNAGGAYGRNVAMAFDAVYDPGTEAALGLLALDPGLSPKLIRRFPGGGLSVLHLPAEIAPGASRIVPPAELMAARGNWRPIAARYGAWLHRSFPARKPPAWLSEIDLYTGPWIPHPDAVAAAKKAGAGFRSFADLPMLYANDPFDLKEWAQYNDGVRQNPRSYGAYMADGVYRFRADLGGEAAAREGIAKLHRMGRRAIFYIAGNSLLKDSPVFAGGRIDDWLLMDRPGHGYDIGYPNGVSVCPGYAPWQDHLARTAARILRETGADGIRLDELATVVPCFNPAHKHDSPYDGVQWLRALTKKVRAAMDAVNPETLLLTEGPLDVLHESCDGALQMFGPGRDCDVMRVALPGYRIFAYHPGAVEAARNGLIGGRTSARRTEFPWSHRGLTGRPADYAEGGGPDLRWHELRATFAEAIDRGTVAALDPKAPREPRWVGRLFVGKRFSVLVGGAEDGRPLPGPVDVEVFDLPKYVQRAVGFDIATGAVDHQLVLRDGDRGRMRVPAAFTAILLAGDECPPIPELTLPATIRRGESVTAKVRWAMAGQWRGASRAMVNTGGLEAPVYVPTPGTFALRAAADAELGLHWVRLDGDVLPVKRWIRVVE